MAKKTNKKEVVDLVSNDMQCESGSSNVQMLYATNYTDDDLEKYIEEGEIKASDKPKTPQEILFVDDTCIATFDNFSVTIGKAKSKKTYNVSAMSAACISNSTVLKYRANLPEGKRKVLYFDTEQSRYHCHNVLERVLKLAKLPSSTDTDKIKFIGLREYSPSLRISLIDYALRTYRGYGFVVIDGIRDLMYDINNCKEATDVMTLLMKWTSKYNLHIHCILHQNKNDSNSRGHIGTELENKAETVLTIAKDNNNSIISEVTPKHMRAKEFSSFAFSINDQSLPALEDGYHVMVTRPKDKPLNTLPEDVHQEVLGGLFETHSPQNYSELVKCLQEAYAAKGYKRGINDVKKLLQVLTTKKVVFKGDDKVYHYNSNFDVESD